MTLFAYLLKNYERQEADKPEAGRQEEQSEREVREDKDEDEMVERGAENSDMAFTRHQFSKPNQPDPKLIAKQSLAKYTLEFSHSVVPEIPMAPCESWRVYCAFTAPKPLTLRHHLLPRMLIQHSFHLGLKIGKKPLSDLLCMRDLIVIRQP